MSLSAVLDSVLFWMGALGCLGFFAFYAYYLVGTLRAPRLVDQHPPRPASQPKVSIIIPACNEEQKIEAAMRTLLAQDYAPLEIVAVDDRSTDGTGAVLDRLAAEDPRLTVVHNRDRPPGWLGKVHAMHRGFEASRGELVVFSDGDVRMAPDLLAKAVAVMEDGGFDHFTLMPPFEAKGLVIGSMLSSFFFAFVARVRSSRVELGAGAPPFGFGAFNMVRRSAFEASAGCDWFKMEILDDAALGEMMKARGRSGFAVSGDMKLEYYASLRAAVIGWEKNFPAALGQYQPLRIFGTALAFLWLSISPFLLVLLRHSEPAFCGLAMVALLPSVILAIAGRLRFGQPLLPALLQPLSMFLMGLVLARSGVLWLRRGGILWRGTFYSARELREGMRVSFRL